MRNQLAYLGFTLLAACGGAASEMAPDATEMPPDAGMGEGGDGGPQVDRSCSIATGRASILAVLHDATGAVQGKKLTDASGKASWDECPADAQISYASLSEVTGWHGATIASVQPGDHFEVVLESGDVVSEVMVGIPTDGADISYIRAHLGGACYQASTEGATANVKLRRDCLRGAGAVPVLASGKIGAVSVYSHGSAAAMVQGGQTIVDNMSTWMTGPQVNLTATNIPGSGVAFYANPIRDARAYGGIAAPKTAMNGSASAALSVAPSSFSTIRRVSVATSSSAQQGIARETSAYEASFDLSTVLFPVAGIIIDDSDAARPELAVTGYLADADVGLLSLEWTANQVPVQWRLLYPAELTSAVVFPELPGELAVGAPTQLEALDVTVFDVTGSSYADVLTRGYHFNEYNHDCPVLPAGSECRFSTYQGI